MKKNKRFRAKSGRRRGQASRHLKRQVEELSQTGELDAIDERSREARRRSGPQSRPKPGAGVEPGDEAVEWDGPRYPGTVASLASGVAWIRPDSADVDASDASDAGHATDPGSAETEPDWPLDDDGLLLCVLPTSLAHDQRSRIAVGDRVHFAPHGDDHRVIELLARRTFLARPDPLHGHLQRIVVANVDIVVQVASVRKPPLRPALVDRYLIAIQQGGAAPVLAVNKIDLVPPHELADELAPLAAYEGLDLPVIPCSAETGQGLDQLRHLLRGKTVAFVGHSGVGKSSLINALAPEVDAAVGAISEALDKGKHTTTRSNLYSLGDGIDLIDTPGIREMGLLDLDAASLADYFPDFAAYAPACRFTNCSHSHEPGCAVRQAVEQGEIPEARHATYLRILASLDDDGR